MIYDGRNGYLTGDMNQAVGTVLAMTKGPVKGKNWFNATVNPAYSISITAAAAGRVALQGTNDIAYRSDNDARVTVEADFLPTDGATWTDIQAATGVTVSGSFAIGYEFIRLVITTQGTGFVTQAWVRWS